MTSSSLGNIAGPENASPKAAGDEDLALNDSVVITKFDPTPQRTHLIVRPRLLAALDAQLQTRLTLVTAPAGYGKTTLLTEWYNQLKGRGLPVGWLLLDTDDGDAPHVTKCLALALARAGVTRAAKLAAAPIVHNAGIKQHLTALLNIIATEDRDVILILDEFEHLPIAVVEEVFLPILDKAPANLHLVIASREPPPLKLGSLRAQGHVNEIHAGDLRFDISEIHGLFGDAVNSAELKLLESQTSGWPVAVQLLRGVWFQQDRRAQVLRDIGTLDDTLTDYLSEQVFSTLPQDIFDLLVHLSPIDRMSPGISEFMAGPGDAWIRIMAAESLAPFLIPLDIGLKVYRAHPIIRAYFKARLDERPSTERNPVYRRAAEWYATAGRLVSALKCATAARDSDLAGRLIEDAGGITIWLRSGLPQLRAIIQAVDEDVLGAFPRVKLLKPFLYVKEGNVRESRRLFEEIRRETHGFEQDREGGSLSLLKLDSLVLESTLLVNECQTPNDSYLADYERTIISISDDDDVFLGSLKNRLAISHCQRGHFDRAIREAIDSLDHYRQSGLTHGEFFARLHMGTAYFAQARVQEAQDSHETAREIWRTVLDEEKTKQALLQAHILELEYERAQNPLSMRKLTETMGVFEHCEWWYDAFAAAAIPLVMTQRATQGMDAARDALSHCRALVEQRQAEGLLPLLNAIEISCFALSGMVTKAGDLLEKHGFSPEHELRQENEEVAWRQREAIASAIARVYIRDGRTQAARDLLRQLTQWCGARGEIRSAIRLGLLKAVAHHVAGETDQSRRTLSEVIRWAAPAGYARPFLEEGELARNLIEQHLDALRSDIEDAAFLDRLVTHLRGARGAENAPILSDRELMVIQHVARGLTDKEIARELDVAPNTVKFHLKNIFRKLGARNRAQAVSYSQTHGLIKP